VDAGLGLVAVDLVQQRREDAPGFTQLVGACARATPAPEPNPGGSPIGRS
jgi:hypothetical protein